MRYASTMYLTSQSVTARGLVTLATSAPLRKKVKTPPFDTMTSCVSRPGSKGKPALIEASNSLACNE